MAIKLDKTRPICPQIEERICVMIANGELSGGQKLKSVREMAISLSVNPNTVQKAFENLEARGVLVSQRGSGWFAAEDTKVAKDALSGIIDAKISEFVSAMKDLGVGTEEILLLIKERKE